MFGRNPVSKPRELEEGFLLHSMFYTIQGEGPWAGKPTIFIRLAGCNLQCAFCDTEFTEGARKIDLSGLLALMAAMSAEHECKRFVLTGGEPMLQRIDVLMQCARGDIYGCLFQIETAGTVWPHGLSQIMPWRTATPTGEEDFCTIVCSPKTPKVHKAMPMWCDHWKYIVQVGLMDENGWPLVRPGGPRVFVPDPAIQKLRFADTFYMQPCDLPDDPAASAANMRLASTLALLWGRMLSVQIHKVAGLE
jgi:organic radical activating enzyme